MVIRSKWRRVTGGVATWSPFTSHTMPVVSASSCTAFPMCDMSNPYTSSQNGMVVASLDTPAMKMVAVSGSKAPPGLRNLSRANSTVSSMLSNSSAYPIHSDTITSTLSKGISSSSSLPCRMVMVPSTSSSLFANPLAAAPFLATSAMNALPSTPYTLAAPARAANMERMPVPHPTSITAAPLNSCGLPSMASRYAFVRTLSLIISRWMTKWL
mmetsp:Transcript_35884/g.60469  ORF Transcript_35884/g.60469 Transcript_35884/m.60469 type:complete len:213 (-) Transcript_35884:958-1596(-)